MIYYDLFWPHMPQTIAWHFFSLLTSGQLFLTTPLGPEVPFNFIIPASALRYVIVRDLLCLVYSPCANLCLRYSRSTVAVYVLPESQRSRLSLKLHFGTHCLAVKVQVKWSEVFLYTHTVFTGCAPAEFLLKGWTRGACSCAGWSRGGGAVWTSPSNRGMLVSVGCKQAGSVFLVRQK